MAKKRPMFWFEEPVDEFRRMQEDFFENFQEMFKMPLSPRRMSKNFKFPEIRTSSIPIKIGESDNELILRAELPDFSKDEIKLKVTPKTFFISGEKKKQSVDKGEKFFRMEKDFNSFSRAVSLPEEVNTEDVKAKFENGFLEVSMPKKEARKKEREVKIN